MLCVGSIHRGSIGIVLYCSTAGGLQASISILCVALAWHASVLTLLFHSFTIVSMFERFFVGMVTTSGRKFPKKRMQFEHRNQYAREVCGWLQVGYIAYSWSYCWFQHTKWLYCWFQSPKSSVTRDKNSSYVECGTYKLIV